MFRHIVSRMSTRPSSCSVEEESSLETGGQSCSCRALESYCWNEDFDEKLTRTWCIDYFIFVLWEEGFTRRRLTEVFFLSCFIRTFVMQRPPKTYRQRNEYNHRP